MPLLLPLSSALPKVLAPSAWKSPADSLPSGEAILNKFLNNSGRNEFRAIFKSDPIEALRPRSILFITLQLLRSMQFSMRLIHVPSQSYFGCSRIAAPKLAFVFKHNTLRVCAHFLFQAINKGLYTAINQIRSCCTNFSCSYTSTARLTCT